MCIPKKIVWGIKYEKINSDTASKLGYTEGGSLSLETVFGLLLYSSTVWAPSHNDIHSVESEHVQRERT